MPAHEHTSTFDPNLSLLDLEEVIRYARGIPESNGKVGVVGFCAGGLMAFLSAARTWIDAAVAYCGAGTEPFLEELSRTHTPLLAHLGDSDEILPDSTRTALQLALGQADSADVVIHAGCSHAFARRGSESFNESAAQAAFQSSRRFLHRHLR
ncbi:dienelactone hydrolase family protein [Dyella sp. Tek66A03]|uniref:dienelactone hydrolase family protein n=1 Tax=Dyella sp. Tek66A03 TaxID=3458298 RepID=UPI00403EEFC8